MELLQHYCTAYFCQAAAFSVMGTHYHLIVHFDQPTSVPRSELERRAYFLYPSPTSRRVIAHWSDERWERFRKRLYDVSELMRNIQSAFARWYNKTFDRRGAFWGGRFKSVYLQHGSSVLDCMLYVDLNPVRAGLVERPEEWQGSSVYLREIGEGEWLLPLQDVIEARSEDEAMVEYRARLYYRGSVQTKPGQSVIPDHVVEAEEQRGFAVRGVYRRRLGYFVDGLVIGTEAFIRSKLQLLRAAGVYQRRRNPIPQLGGIHYTLREQRGTTIVF